MILELDSSEFKWLSAFLSNYIVSERVDRYTPDVDKKIMIAQDIISTKKEKSKLYLVLLDSDSWEFLYDMISNNRCCCPECSKKSVKYRKDIGAKLEYLKMCVIY